MAFLYSNFAKATLSRAIDELDTTLLIPTDEQDGFPVIADGSGNKFVVVLTDGRQAPEVAYVTGQASGEFTVQRGREGSAPKSWPVGTAIVQAVTAAVLNAFGGGDIDPAILDAIYDAIENVEVQAIAAQASADAASASVTVEASARVAGDAANASLITTVDARVDDSFAAISAETTARVDSVAAVASDVTSLTAVVGANTANITAETLARSNADSSLATQITNLTATVNTNYGTVTASIASEATARSNADVALANRASTLEAQMANTSGSGLSARIATEETTRASADSALSSRTSNLEATVNNGSTGVAATYARLLTEETTRATADTALGTRTTALESTVNNGTSGVAATYARLLTEETTRASADSALASRTSTIETTLATKPNLLTDPSFANGVAGLADLRNTGGDWTDGRDANGRYVFSTSAPGAGLVNGHMTPWFPFEAGNVVSFSADFEAHAVTSGVVLMDVEWGTAAQANNGYTTQVSAGTSIWPTVNSNAIAVGLRTAPANTVYARLRFYMSGAVFGAGGYVRLRRPKVEQGATSSLYSDDASVAVVTARVATEETTRASADTALASSITTVSTNLGTTNAQVTANTTAIATNTTSIGQVTSYAEANYSMQLAAGGYFASFSLKAAGSSGTTGGISEFRINAAKFLIDGKYPMTYNSGTGTLSLQNIEVDGALIKNLSVDNAAIKDLTLAGVKLGLGEVETERLYSYIPPADTPDTAFNYPLGDCHNYTTHNVTGGPLIAITVGPQSFAGVECRIKCILNFPNNTLTGAGIVELRYDGALIQNWEMFMDRNQFFMEVDHTPSAGSHSYTLQVAQNTGSGWSALKLGYRALKITEKIGGFKSVVGGSS